MALLVSDCTAPLKTGPHWTRRFLKKCSAVSITSGEV
jgi:hypothetical protein